MERAYFLDWMLPKEDIHTQSRPTPSGQAKLQAGSLTNISVTEIKTERLFYSEKKKYHQPLSDERIGGDTTLL